MTLRRRLIAANLVGLAVLVAAVWLRQGITFGIDAWAYRAGLPYRAVVEIGVANFIYSPAFALVMSPLAALPFESYIVLWSELAILAYAWLLWPLPLHVRAPLLVLAVIPVSVGNVEWALALACVVGLRYPAAWAFPLLTKVTPGVGVLWFAFRREWRQVAVAGFATLAVVAASALFVGPEAWRRWVEVLAYNATRHAGGYVWPEWMPAIPLAVRGVAAVVLLAWGAPRGKAWTIPAAVMLGQPDWHPWTLGILAAIPRLRGDHARVLSRRRIERPLIEGEQDLRVYRPVHEVG